MPCLRVVVRIKWDIVWEGLSIAWVFFIFVMPRHPHSSQAHTEDTRSETLEAWTNEPDLVSKGQML